MNEKKFDPKKLKKLNNPDRLLDIPPEYIRSISTIETADTMVEIGAGTAFFSIALLPVFTPSVVYACDVSQVMLEWMKENVSPNYPKIIPLKAEETVVPLDDGTADLVYMINLHHELEDPAATLKDAYRLLKPDGRIIIVDWKKEKMTEGPPERIRYSPEGVKDQLTDSGFSKVTIFSDLPKHFSVVGVKSPGKK